MARNLGGTVRGGVHQSPASLEAEEGATVDLNCHFDAPRKVPQLVTFQWDLPEGEVYRLVPGSKTMGRTSRRLTLNADLQTRSTTLRIRMASASDSGRYMCVIQILEPLPIIQMKGNGTQLRIIQGNATHQGTNESKVIADLSGNVKYSDTHESKMVAVLTVSSGQAAERKRMDLWCFVLLLCVISVMLIGGLGFSIWMACVFSLTDLGDKGKGRHRRRMSCEPRGADPSTDPACRAAWAEPESA
ncbi:uncharacterized protein [Heterodontus francisci]|uniref:uncharacterized protein isoform X2 n=1 Tax=Heterodontus francisci TaxID=7792 RepID=UPI00355BD15C